MVEWAWRSEAVFASSDVAVKSTAAMVFWLLIQNTHATDACALELNNSADDSGTDLLRLSIPAASAPQFLGPFDPPIHFDTGIWLDLTGGTPLVTVGYTDEP